MVKVKKVAVKLDIDQTKTEEYLAEEKGRFTSALSQIAEYYYDYDFQRQTVIIGDESTVLRYGRFLTKYFGMEVQAAIITDFIGEAGKQAPMEAIKEFASDVFFAKDGSGLENAIAKKRNIPNYIISYPAFGKVIIGKSDAGYQGAVNAMEDISSMLVENKL